VIREAKQSKTSWQTVPLSEVCDFKPSKDIPRGTVADDADVSFVPMNDLGELVKYFEPKEVRKFADVVKNYTYFADGDVLCAKITPCFENGKLGVVSNLECGVGFGSSEFVVMRPTPALSAEFLYYYLSRDAFREAGARVMSGAVGHKRVPKEYFEDLPIPLPPPDEQKRIVAVLDQAFAALDRARAHAEANLANAAEMQVALLSAAIRDATLGETESIKLGALCNIARGGSPRPIKKFLTADENGVNWIKISDATASGKFIDVTRERIIKEGVSRSRFVASGSFLLTNSMSFGRPYILRTNGCIHDGWLVLEPNYAKVDQDYLYHLLGSKQIFSEFDCLAAGSTVRNLNINLVSNVTVNLPSLQKQREAAKRVESGIEKCSYVALRYHSQLEDLAALRQSLLQKAFSGELA